jgi:hypothetical protein
MEGSRMTRSTTRLLPAICCLAAAFAAGCSLLGAREIVFENVDGQSREFIEWYRTIKLTPAQEAVKKAALEALPAPCCSDNSAYTCCCECNVSRTVWGLSHYMIAKQDAGVEQVREKVREWIAFVNPKGYSGKSCYNGGCARKFSNDGCGGMNADRLML